MFGIGKKFAEEATQQVEQAAQAAGIIELGRRISTYSRVLPIGFAFDTAGQTVQQVVEQAKDAGQKALDEVCKVAESGEKAVKNVANQATAWGKSFGQ